ncbi:MAG: redoxin domain-containing protein [Thermoplasmata archaeon]|nr:redoxin domain-containing protein [Candidatus Sysuiplasma acidicola]
MTELKVGEKVPDFTLPSGIGKKVSLNELVQRGTTVIAFYPGDFSSVCTNEWCSFRDGLKEFESLKAKVVGISGDSHFVHEAFKKANSLNFDLLSDYDHEVSKRYGVYYEEFLGLKGVSKRSVFIVDSKGILRFKWVTEDASKLPDLTQIKTELARVN